MWSSWRSSSACCSCRRPPGRRSSVKTAQSSTPTTSSPTDDDAEGRVHHHHRWPPSCPGRRRSTSWWPTARASPVWPAGTSTYLRSRGFLTLPATNATTKVTGTQVYAVSGPSSAATSVTEALGLPASTVQPTERGGPRAEHGRSQRRRRSPAPIWPGWRRGSTTDTSAATD